MPALLSGSQFERLVADHRTGLEHFARKLRHCSHEQAEDLACEAVLYASTRLASFDPLTGEEGWLCWMRGFVRIVCARDRERDARRVPTVSLNEQINAPASPSYGAYLTDRQWLKYLPRELRQTVALHLDGNTNKEISDALGVHRHTVANRLDRANLFARRYFGYIPLPLFNFLNTYASYTPPVGRGAIWRHTHPGDIHFRFDSEGNLRGLTQRGARR